ncbi:TPA: ABC transporter substrate-binding protein [Photobacterium damselae]|uniref:ABC transporter substrate-binding protein n=1 Tax=Photobacterium damselae TaxID=38293 RepID=A0ABD6XCS4_PHODM|nr:ABC transporter substrate-binding protein [Photobacterium damselae]MCG3845870.1 ABC transporter substrate-binding protein [Photobacterium damselae]OBU43893.1 ABC transporter substrate-binding protein [Photobacterium damselae]PSU18783.1 ABC transporter substrate-binding protein [Photobacterium damselae]
MRKTLAFLLLSSLGFSLQAQANECGKVTIADMNWNSASFLANLDQFVLNNAFGCSAELVPGDTMPTGTSMIEKGEPDIAPEFWSNSMKAALDRGVEDKRLRLIGGPFADGGVEGFWVPAYMVEKDPSLATIAGIKKHAKLFVHPEDPSKSAFYTCPSGWNCQISAGNIFRALKLKQAGFELVDPGSGAGLAGSIAKAYERQQPWFGYYWAPTAVLGKYKMVKVDFDSGTDPEYFKSCLTQETCLDPKPSMYPTSQVDTVITESFAGKAGDALKYLQQRALTNEQMNELLAWMEENQADGEIAMEHFLTDYESTWTTWFTPDQTTKLKQALKNL